jgi:hypothetical protein
MAKNIMLKVVEPIMAVTPKQSQYIDYNVSLKDFMVLTCFSIFHFFAQIENPIGRKLPKYNPTRRKFSYVFINT